MITKKQLLERIEELENKAISFVEDYKTKMIVPKINCVEVLVHLRGFHRGLFPDYPIYFLRGYRTKV